MEAIDEQEAIEEDREVEIRRVTALQERENVLWRPKMRWLNQWVVNEALQTQRDEDREKAVSLAVRWSLGHGESKRGGGRSEASRTGWKEMRGASSVDLLLKEK